MNKQRASFWLMIFVGIPAFVWLLTELMRVFLEDANRSGIASVLFDGVIQHKIGELMVGTPLFLIFLLTNKWSKEKIFTLINRLQIVMIVGGLLNALAWFSLRERQAWNSFFRMWCLSLLIVGLLGTPIAKWVVNKSQKNPDR